LIPEIEQFGEIVTKSPTFTSCPNVEFKFPIETDYVI